MKKIAALFSITRPVNFLITFLVISAGYLISADTGISYFIMMTAALSGSLTAASGNIVNDIFDIETDRINHPNRPIPSGILTYNNAKVLWFILALSSFIISSLISIYAFLFVFFIHLLLIFYSFWMKSVPMLGNFTIGILTAMAFVYGAYAAGNLEKIILPAVFAFLINYIREMVKDIEDLKGDISAGVMTFPGKYGIKKTKNVILIFILLLMILSAYPFIFNYYKIEYFVVVMITVNPLLVYCIKMILSDDETKFGRISVILKFNMAAGLAAIILGQ